MRTLEDHYARLGLLPSADESVVRAAYRALTSQLRATSAPGADRRLQEITVAFEAIASANGDAPFGSDWQYALEFYPDLRRVNERLDRISSRLAAEYRSTLLASRNLGSRHELAQRMENEYFERQFGHNHRLVAFARELVAIGHFEAADELGHACQLFGGDHDPSAIIGRIRGKYFIFRTSEGELCTAEAIRILRHAVGQGYEIAVNDRDVIVLRKSTSETFLYSLDQIIRFGNILGFDS